MNNQEEQIRRDERGRPIGEDNYPISGLASVAEVALVSGLSVGLVYKMIHAGELESRRFGRSVRVPWAALRESGLL